MYQQCHEFITTESKLFTCYKNSQQFCISFYDPNNGLKVQIKFIKAYGICRQRRLQKKSSVEKVTLQRSQNHPVAGNANAWAVRFPQLGRIVDHTVMSIRGWRQREGYRFQGNYIHGGVTPLLFFCLVEVTPWELNCLYTLCPCGLLCIAHQTLASCCF